jgi:hypothetical protein
MIGKFTTFAALATAAVLSLSATGASAVTGACVGTPPNGAVTQDGVGSLSCEISNTADQDFLNTNPITVNAEEFFSFDDWIFAGRQNENSFDTGVDVGFSASVVTSGGDWESGEWSFDATKLVDYSDAMLIFKSGNNTFLTGYLLANLTTPSGDFTNPFSKGISHVSAYVREGDPTTPPPGVIPLPAAGWLLISGMAGLGFLGRRKAKA